MTRHRCLDCQDGRPCRHRGYVPAGTILAPCRCLDCDPQPIQARLFSHALVENDLGDCIDCGEPASKLLVGGPGQPDTSSCERCEYRRSLQATGGRDTPTRNAPAGACPGPTSARARRRAAPPTSGGRTTRHRPRPTEGGMPTPESHRPSHRPRQLPNREVLMNRRNRQRRIWSINMGDGTWAVSCMWCRKPLGRGSARWARKAVNKHVCR